LWPRNCAYVPRQHADKVKQSYVMKESICDETIDL
jgi:hypothetical protein